MVTPSNSCSPLAASTASVAHVVVVVLGIPLSESCSSSWFLVFSIQTLFSSHRNLLCMSSSSFLVFIILRKLFTII